MFELTCKAKKLLLLYLCNNEAIRVAAGNPGMPGPKIPQESGSYDYVDETQWSLQGVQYYNCKKHIAIMAFI